MTTNIFLYLALALISPMSKRHICITKEVLRRQSLKHKIQINHDVCILKLLIIRTQIEMFQDL